MSDINLNPLSQHQRRFLQFGAGLVLVVFLIIFFVTSRKTPEVKVKNNSVYIENSTLYVFDDTYSLSQYPDRVLMHYPYLLVIKPSQQTNYIYNLQTKQKEKTVSESLIDYDGKNTLTNQGKTSFFNSTDLDVLCDLGFIKSDTEVLCVTKVDPNFMENKLININISTKKKTDVYISKNMITAVSIINGTIYLGINDLYTKKNYLVIDKTQIEFPDWVGLIYQMDSKPYVASMKSAFNNNMESWYEINAFNVTKLNNVIVTLFE